MNKLKRLIITFTFAFMLLAIGTAVDTNAATVGRVKSIKVKTQYKTYKGYTSALDMKLRKIKYKYGARVSWNKVKKADGYEVYVYGYASKSWRKLKSTKKTSYTITNLNCKDKVKVRVRAYKKKSGQMVYGGWSKSKTYTAKDSMFKKKTGGGTKVTCLDRYAAEQAFVLQNKTRVKKGAGNIKWSETLYEICEIRAKEISEDFSHDRFRATSLNVLQKKFGVTDLWYDTIDEDGYETGEMYVSTENIACGASDYDMAIDSWIDSPGHYKNMINKSHKYGAIACYKSKKSIFWVAVFSDCDIDNILK